ncbi:hypothetical protein GPALN_010342 [Globodera pallida]|nr:hypothetical protein GPALN_010342 [Globodera pallida]
MRTYDDQIAQSRQAWNAHELISDLKSKKFNIENGFGVLGDGTITDGTKFEIKLDWKKAHDAYFMRKFDPIYVQIYAVNEPLKTSLVERILINPSSEVEYEFIYGTPRDQIGVKLFTSDPLAGGSSSSDRIPKAYKLELKPEVDEFFQKSAEFDEGDREQQIGKIMVVQISLISANYFYKLARQGNIDGDWRKIGQPCARIVDVNGQRLECFGTLYDHVNKAMIKFEKTEIEKEFLTVIYRTTVVPQTTKLVELEISKKYENTEIVAIPEKGSKIRVEQR